MSSKFIVELLHFGLSGTIGKSDLINIWS